MSFVLTGLEVVASNERLVLLGEVDHTRNKRVLGRTVDERNTLQDGGNGKDGRRADFRVGSFDRGKNMVSGVIDTRDEVAIAFGVRGPEHNDAVQLVVLLERTNILANMLDVLVLVASRDKVIGTGFLVGSDKVWVVDGRERGTDVGHVGGNLALKVIVEHLGTVHRLVHGTPEMSQPPRTRSFGCTIGSTSPIGTWTSLPAASLPRRTVDARSSEPM